MKTKIKIMFCMLFSYFIIVSPSQAIKQNGDIPPKVIDKKKHIKLLPIKIKRIKFGRRVSIYAKKFLGVRYVWGGQSPSGFDCSGLVRYVFKKFKINLPHNAAAQYRYGNYVTSKNLMPGDLLFYNGLGHVGIYMGNGIMIHSPQSGSYVQLTKLSGRGPFYGAKRIKSNG